MFHVCSLFPFSSAALIVSFSSQLVFNNLPNNPLLAIFSPKEAILSTPLRVIFNVSSLLIHYFLAFNLSSQFRVYFYPYSDPTSLSYRFLYSTSLLAPTTSLFFEIPWKVAIWWSYTPLVVFAVHRVTNSIENIDREIANLEGMKYKAPGAWAIYHHALLLTVLSNPSYRYLCIQYASSSYFCSVTRSARAECNLPPVLTVLHTPCQTPQTRLTHLFWENAYAKKPVKLTTISKLAILTQP